MLLEESAPIKNIRYFNDVHNTLSVDELSSDLTLNLKPNNTNTVLNLCLKLGLPFHLYSCN